MESRFLTIESITTSLVREYLHRKELKSTLNEMDKESPRPSNSISNRRQLAQALHMEKLVQQNKDSGKTSLSMLELMTQYFMEKADENVSTSDNLAKRDALSKYDNCDSPLSGHLESKVAKTRSNTNELVISEDVGDSETILGDGKACLSEKRSQQSVDFKPDVKPTKEAPQNSAVARVRGMSGPIVNSSEHRDKRNPQIRISRPLYRILTSDDTSPKPCEPSTTPASLRPLTSDPSSPPTTTSNNSPAQPIKNARRFPKAESVPANLQWTPPVGGDGEARFEPPLIIGATEGSAGLLLPKKSQSSISKMSPATNDLNNGDVKVIGPVAMRQDQRGGPRGLSSGGPAAALSASADSKPLDLATAIKLKTLIFGSANQNFKDEWRLQSFSFCDFPKLRYGIVQKKGGPCGILACVQAYIIKELAFKDLTSNSSNSSICLEPTRQERSLALASALADILWKAGGQISATVAIPGIKCNFYGNNKFKTDGLTEMLTLHKFASCDNLERFLQSTVGWFETDNKGGVILVLYSAILSRGIDNIRIDMDEHEGHLMGAHGYCSQDIVNLLLTGRAASNIFNDQVELDGGTEGATVLKGVHCRSDIGLLSLFEHYKSCQVGTYLKTPKFPIWVVCSESHYSVLFCLNKDLVNDWKVEKRFDLYYYDGLARQEREIKLSIDTTNKFYNLPNDEQLTSPLEHCIHTKWSGAEISWNGTEPLL